MRIEIVRSSIVGLSSMGIASCEGIRKVLTKHFKHVGVSTVNTCADLDVLVAKQPDLVFLGMKYVPSNPVLGIHDPNKIWLGDYLDKHDIAYTGSGAQAHALELDKSLSKKRVLECGLSTAQYFVVKQHQPHGQNNLQFPLFVKPIDRGGGLGIDEQSVVYDELQLQAKLDSLSNILQADALVESYLPGREFSVAIIKDLVTGQLDTMPLELIAPLDSKGHRLLSDKVKAADTETFLPVEPGVLKESIQRLALRVFTAIGAQDYGRIDIRLDSSNMPQFLEANLIPSLLNHYGNFPKACLVNRGITYEDMVLQIVALGIRRSTTVLLQSLDFAVEFNESETLPHAL